MPPILADEFTFGDFAVWTLWIFGFVVFFWLLVTVFSDLFRRHDENGWIKALWVLFVIFLPLLGILMDRVTQGPGMAQRAQQARQEAIHAARRELGISAADELRKLDELKAAGSLSEEEYQKMRSRIIG